MSINMEGRSYKKINYSLRPAKCIERKMMVEAFKNLSDYTPIKDYQYVGFGSLSFSDFILFHKEINISKMISIEHDSDENSRFEFNRPFNCVNVVFGDSKEKLREFDWNNRLSLVWLDYDGQLTSDVLADIKYLCTVLMAGSILIVSVNAHPGYPLEPKRIKLEKLKSQIGENKVPIDVKGTDLLSWGYAKLCRKIINNEVLETLNDRNCMTNDDRKLVYEQLFNFHYADGVNMLTTGGIIVERRHNAELRASSVHNLPFILSDQSCWLIDPPILTIREIGFLNSLLPSGVDLSDIDLKGIPIEIVKKYEKVYRYFPAFLEAEI